MLLLTLSHAFFVNFLLVFSLLYGFFCFYLSFTIFLLVLMFIIWSLISMLLLDLTYTFLLVYVLVINLPCNNFYSCLIFIACLPIYILLFSLSCTSFLVIDLHITFHLSLWYFLFLFNLQHLFWFLYHS